MEYVMPCATMTPVWWMALTANTFTQTRYSTGNSSAGWGSDSWPLMTHKTRNCGNRTSRKLVRNSPCLLDPISRSIGTRKSMIVCKWLLNAILNCTMFAEPTTDQSPFSYKTYLIFFYKMLVLLFLHIHDTKIRERSYVNKIFTQIIIIQITLWMYTCTNDMYWTTLLVKILWRQRVWQRWLSG